MKLINTVLMTALLTFTVATVAQAAPSDTPLKSEVKVKDQNLMLACSGLNPRSCAPK